jgi:hypothetical protein
MFDYVWYLLWCDLGTGYSPLESAESGTLNPQAPGKLRPSSKARKRHCSESIEWVSCLVVTTIGASYVWDKWWGNGLNMKRDCFLCAWGLCKVYRVWCILWHLLHIQTVNVPSFATPLAHFNPFISWCPYFAESEYYGAYGRMELRSLKLSIRQHGLVYDS